MQEASSESEEEICDKGKQKKKGRDNKVGSSDDEEASSGSSKEDSEESGDEEGSGSESDSVDKRRKEPSKRSKVKQAKIKEPADGKAKPSAETCARKTVGVELVGAATDRVLNNNKRPISFDLKSSKQQSGSAKTNHLKEASSSSSVKMHLSTETAKKVASIFQGSREKKKSNILSYPSDEIEEMLDAYTKKSNSDKL